MIKLRRAAALAAAFALIILCTACGKDSGSGSGVQNYGSNNGNAQTLTEEYGNGFSQNHAVEAGFGMGMDTLEDITGRYGQPDLLETNEYTSVTVAYAEYDFGSFEFEGAPGTTPVLTYVQINSQITAPCGIDFGADIESAAEKIFTGSGNGLTTAAEQQKYFYGSDSAGTEYGRYTMLTIEFISSSTNDTYSLEYRADSYDEGRMTLYTLYFNAEHNMTWYTLRYI